MFAVLMSYNLCVYLRAEIILTNLDIKVSVAKVVLYQDTVSVEPGSSLFLDSVSVSKDTFMGLDRCRGLKRYILLILTILFMCRPTDLQTGLLSVSKDTLQRGK